jgi:acetyl-CoA carboxylase biotin carboxyl carrier protein
MKDQESQQGKSAKRPKAKESEKRSAHGSRRSTYRASTPEASINMDELRELIALILENGLAEFELEREGFRVRLRRNVELLDAETGTGQLAEDKGTTEEASGVVNTESAAVPPKTGGVSLPAHPGARAETAASEDQGLHIISSPIVGTFYRAASPNSDSFVKIGSQVESDTVVCIIEAMKLMNEIQAETTGEVAKIYVENGQPVEYGQPLFGIKK